VVTQVEKVVVVNKVGKPGVKPRILTFVEKRYVRGVLIFEPAKYV
jgi:hypothetical protein